MMVIAWGTQKMNETKVKSFPVKKKTLHVGMELKQAQKQGRDYTAQKKTNLIQKEYPIHLFQYTIKRVEQMYCVLFL